MHVMIDAQWRRRAYVFMYGTYYVLFTICYKLYYLSSNYKNERKPTPFSVFRIFTFSQLATAKR